MEGYMDRNKRLYLLQGVVLAMLAAMLGWTSMAKAQSADTAQAPGATTASASAPATKPTISDAQVQANVLKALAGAPDLANQPMTTTTVYGVVTLSGTVQTEALRVEAETIVSKTKGVQKVVDEMTLGGESASAQPADQAAAPVVEGSPDADNTGAGSQEANQAGVGSAGPGYGQPQQGYSQQPRGYAPAPVYGGQEAGITVTVPVSAHWLECALTRP